jgi:hypothetical protein
MPKLLRLLRCRHWLLPWQPEQQQLHHFVKSLTVEKSFF